MAAWIRPRWPAPQQVRALTTTRMGGESEVPFASLNLAQHVGDDPERVAANRRRLRVGLDLPEEPLWLEQVHGCTVVSHKEVVAGCEADASVAWGPGRVCAVLTADCLPVLLCDRLGTRVAAVHAGWRGLAAGVVEAVLDTIGGDAEDLLCWLGPAIGPSAYQVGGDVRERFLEQDPRAVEAFRPFGDEGRWYADIYSLARQRLLYRGVQAIYGGDCCTYSDPGRFFSFRRDGTTGRMASLIWLAE